MKRKLKCISAVLAALLLITFTGCSGNEKTSEPISRTGILLDTVVMITLYDTDDTALLDGCFDMIADYEAKLSRTLETSEIYRLNRREISEVSPETAELIQKGLEYSQRSQGAFDITIGSVSSLWDFSSGAGTVPDAELISEALTHVGYEGVRVNGCTVTFDDPGTMLDLGAIAKGYIADRIKDYLSEKGVASAIIYLGGNTLCMGEKPSGDPFRVGVQYPFKETGELITVLSVKDMSIVSSGSYERYFVSDGVSYHHILDPGTGYSCVTDITGVSIICPSSVDADALSTICFILGEEKASELIDSIDGTYAVFIRPDGTLGFSEGAEAFAAD